jgi:hypothetical protein
MPSVSYTPKASNYSAIVNPIKHSGNDLKFTKDEMMSFIQQNPEVLTEGFWKGRVALTEGAVKGVTSALSGVTGALTSKAAETKATTDATTAFERAKEIARIQAEPFKRPNTTGITFRGL